MKKFIFSPKTPAESEIVQRLAFEFGYEWSTNGKFPVHLDQPHLHFYPNDSRIAWSFNRVDDDLSEKMVSTITDVLVEFKRPKSIEVGAHSVDTTGGVSLHRQFPYLDRAMLLALVKASDKMVSKTK